MENQAVAVANQTLITFGILLTTGAVAAKIADYLKLPDIVMYLLAGIVIGPPMLGWINVPPGEALNQLVLTLGASLLLFHGGIGVSWGILRQVWVTLLLASTVSVGVMICVVGWAAHYFLGIDWMYAFLLAAVLAPTDPAALVPLFLSVKIRERLAQTVLSESAFNDATAAMAAFTILGGIVSSQMSFGASLGKFMIMAGGGMVTGLVYGGIVGFLLSDKARDIFSEYAQVLMLPVVIASYMTAEHFGASGFMAVFVAGLVIGNLDELGWTLRESSHDEVHSFIHIASLLLRILIFILLGSHVNFENVMQYLLPGLAVVAVFMLVARPLAVLCATLPDRQARWEKKEIIFMFWTRETGVIPAALVGMLNGSGIAHTEVVAAVVFIGILVTIGVQATTTKWLAQRLGLLAEEETTDEIYY